MRTPLNDLPSAGKAFAIARVSAVRFAMVPSEVMFQGDVLILDVGGIELLGVAKNEPVHPAEKLPLYEGRCFCTLDLDLVLVEAHHDHLEQDHEVGYSARHMADIVGVGHFYRVLDHVVLDLVQDVYDQHRIAGDVGMIEYAGKLVYRDRRVDPSLFLEKIMNHIKEVYTELHKPVR